MTTSDSSGTLPGAPDTTRPNVARAYDYLLGGKDNFIADRELAEKLLADPPRERFDRVVLDTTAISLAGGSSTKGSPAVAISR